MSLAIKMKDAWSLRLLTLWSMLEVRFSAQRHVKSSLRLSNTNESSSTITKTESSDFGGNDHGREVGGHGQERSLRQHGQEFFNQGQGKTFRVQGGALYETKWDSRKEGTTYEKESSRSPSFTPKRAAEVLGLTVRAIRERVWAGHIASPV